MKRREFIKAGAVTLAVAAIIPMAAAEKPWQEMTLEEFVRDTIRKRRAGVPPNFTHEHYCPNCKLTYLCPDRYVMPSCGPTREMLRMGYKDGKNFRCSPCSMNVDKYGPAGYRELWIEAHGVEKERAA